ncbi:MAG: hypothetical protein ABIO70_00500 [Pseudomonadota bacterium]
MTLLGQVVLLRELAVAFHGSELNLLLGLAGWMAGSALGALTGRWRGAAGRTGTRLAFVAWAILLIASMVACRALGPLSGSEPGAWLPFPTQLAAMAALIGPPAVLAGLLFQRTARGFVADGWGLAMAYAAESAGGLLGGALATGLLLLGVPNLAAGLLAALGALAAAVLPWRPRPRWLLPLALPAALALAAALPLTPRLDAALTRLEHPDLVATRDTPYGRATLDERAGRLALFQDGALAWESEGTDGEVFAHLAALQVAEPRKILVLGGATRGLLPPLLEHGPARIDVVEQDAARLALLRPHLSQEAQAALRDPVVHLVTEDPRRFVRAEGSWDLILVDLPEPTSGATARFTTREFFADCARRLTPGGVLGLRLPGAENLWTPSLTWRNASIQRALAWSFSDILVLPGTTTTWLASSGGLERGARPLAARMAARDLHPRLVSPAFLDYLLRNDRTAEIAAALAASTAPASRDDHPGCYVLTLVMWLSRFVPDLALLDLSATARAWQRPLAAIAAGLALLGAGLLWAARRHLRLGRAVLAVSAGLLGTVTEGVLVTRFQLARGALFGDLGLLLTAFMAGLALGALALDVYDRRLPEDTPPSPWLARAVLLGCAAVPLAAVAMQVLGYAPGLGGTALHLVTAGAATSALFGLASLLRTPGREPAVAPLLGLDLLGGALGSLLVSLALIPFLGLAGGAAAAGALALVLLVIV